jgi:hypothetical protein
MRFARREWRGLNDRAAGAACSIGSLGARTAIACNAFAVIGQLWP